MKRTVLALSFLCVAFATRAQYSFPLQDINYNVKYHWGLIDVMIARGVVSIQSDGNEFYGTLNGTSIPWEGKIICVSDTLRANMSSEGGRLVESVQYQSGWYRHPSVSLFRSATYNPDDPAIFKNIAGQGEYSASRNSMEAVTVTSDMLGLYYYSHIIEFDKLQPGERFEIQINGPYARSVIVTYEGQTIYNVNGDRYPAYECTFEYSYDGRMSGYPVKCYIGATDKIPLYFSASLPVGQVEMLYEPPY